MLSESLRPEVTRRIIAYHLLHSTLELHEERVKQGSNISFPLAVAINIQEDAEKEIGPTLTFVGKQDAGVLYQEFAKTDYDFGKHDQRPFFQLISGALLRSIIESLEQGGINGWTDDLFPQRLDSFLGKYILVPKIIMPKEDEGERHTRFMAETHNIRQVLFNDPTLLSFFQQEGGHTKLPQNIRLFLNENPFWGLALQAALSTYEIACPEGIKILAERPSWGATKK